MPQYLDTQSLARPACEELLSSTRFGRLAFTFRDRVDIRPIGFVFRDGWIFGRTSEGTKLEVLRHHRWVAFQVDRIRDQWNWTSVLVHGAFHLLAGTDGAAAPDPELVERARTALQAAMPGTFTSSDPARHRDLLFGIEPHEITGVTARLVNAPPRSLPSDGD